MLIILIIFHDVYILVVDNCWSFSH